LRGRFIAAAAVAALLRHRAADFRPFRFHRVLQRTFSVDPRFGRFAGRGFIANIDVAIGHDWNPLLRFDHNAQLPKKVARGSIESAGRMLRFMVVERPWRLFHQRKVKNSNVASCDHGSFNDRPGSRGPKLDFSSS
jgi:hypothetical protein